MLSKGRLTWKVLGLAIGVWWLAGCGLKHIPRATVSQERAVGETRAVPPATEGPLVTPGLPTLARTGISELRASSSPPPSPTATSPAARPAFSPAPPNETPYCEVRSGPVRLLDSYYNAVNLREYSRAWGYWETPPSASFEEFAAGSAGTESVMLVVRSPTSFEEAAGSPCASVPTRLSAVHTDGSWHNFAGSFFARRPDVDEPGIEQEWSLFDAAVQRTPGSSTAVTVLEQVCLPI